MLTLVTATGCRPQAWALCERWMLAQDYSGAVRWVVVDDGSEPQPITFERDGWAVEVIRPVPYWSQGMNSQARNLLAGLGKVGAGDSVVFIEDDDFYGPGYLSAVAGWLKDAEMVGECAARYYNVAQRKGRQLKNEMHASLCSTAVRGNAINFVRSYCKPGVQYIDVHAWAHFRGPKRLHKTKHVVGIKGLPGRGGIGMGHKDNFRGDLDPDGAMLRDWIGKDAEAYL